MLIKSANYSIHEKKDTRKKRDLLEFLDGEKFDKVMESLLRHQFHFIILLGIPFLFYVIVQFYQSF
ncbi:DUF3930 family protein [Bacillus timonensis]|nr:DUF3930 family protein [Bacillus timonensis]